MCDVVQKVQFNKPHNEWFFLIKSLPIYCYSLFKYKFLKSNRLISSTYLVLIFCPKTIRTQQTAQAVLKLL